MNARIRTDILAVGCTFLVALVALGTAWTAQYGFDLFPCELCMYQRLPYYGVVALSLLSLMPVVDSESRRLAMQVASLLFLATAGVAGFHVGVEQGLWESSCATNGAQAFTFDDIQAALQRPGTPACDDIPFTLFGVSMAGYNLLAGIVLAATAFWTTKQKSFWQ
jgi:disulfide bond formation protein DsbB